MEESKDGSSAPCDFSFANPVKLGRRETEFDAYVRDCEEKIASLDAQIDELNKEAKPKNRNKNRIQRLVLDQNDPLKVQLDKLRGMRSSQKQRLK